MSHATKWIEAIKTFSESEGLSENAHAQLQQLAAQISNHAAAEVAEATHEELRRDSMIDLLNAVGSAFANRVEFWKDTAQRVPKIIHKKSHEKKAMQKIIECQIRSDENKALQGLMRATLQTILHQDGRAMVKGCSPLPWKMEKDDGGYFSIVDSEGIDVASSVDSSSVGAIELKENAEMILMAVNMFAPTDGYLEPGQTVKPDSDTQSVVSVDAGPTKE